MSRRRLLIPLQSRGARALALAIAGAVAGLVFDVMSAAGAQPLPADDLPQTLLTACDEQAKAVGEFAGPIAAAVNELIEAGVFQREAIEGVRIGFCDLRNADGPVAATSCLDDVILLDAKYEAPSQALVRNATLAHEMKHVLQHREKKAAYGEGYCLSEAYETDKPGLEAEADKFGDEALEILLLQGKYYDD